MWDAIAAAIKAFSEKYIVPLVLAVVVAICSVIFLPDDYWMIVKVGKVVFGIAVAGIVFLLVLFVIFIVGLAKRILMLRENEKYQQEQRDRDIDLYLKRLWSRIDKFSYEDRELIRRFIESENQPIISGGIYSPESLLESDFIESTTIDDENKIYKKAYKLKEDVYQMLKYSKCKYNRISNFD